MRHEGLLMAILILTSVAVPAAAQGLDAGGVEESLNPLVSLVEGVTRVGWTITKMMVGMDDASIAYFTHQLGFRKDEVTMNVTDSADGDEEECPIGSFTTNANNELVCTSLAGAQVVVGTGQGSPIVLTNVQDYNDDGETDLIDGFRHLIRNGYGELNVANGAKGQVMLFALIIPLGIMAFLLFDFFSSTGMLRQTTSQVISLGIALIAARSGVYTALLTMISDIFGAGGFFLSMLSIYLILAVIMWFYGGILRSKAIAESEEEVADAVVGAFAADIRRGIAMKDAAKSRTDKKGK